MEADFRKERLEALFLYMREPAQEDRPVAEHCYHSARAYLKGACGVEDPLDLLAEGAEMPPPGLYELAVNSLALYYFDHRADMFTDAPFPPGLRPIINLLKHGGSA